MAEAAPSILSCTKGVGDALIGMYHTIIPPTLPIPPPLMAMSAPTVLCCAEDQRTRSSRLSSVPLVDY
eukprot:CAMPEP_0196194282 /NCGR_PEP_ID=MMETSP0911-20130528/49982_1 /TAXON_ID=49265 /ORGANISM="Thalassiosira rotula, Strain GSO102" /LENGTH=67 /DNA_ID=CAMNT_0041466555 /DNA_START=109 /DNA_END=312 /DNA_ORIENTATION=+